MVSVALMPCLFNVKSGALAVIRALSGEKFEMKRMR